jgi:hypothetical protein
MTTRAELDMLVRGVAIERLASVAQLKRESRTWPKDAIHDELRRILDDLERSSLSQLGRKPLPARATPRRAHRKPRIRDKAGIGRDLAAVRRRPPT